MRYACQSIRYFSGKRSYLINDETATFSVLEAVLLEQRYDLIRSSNQYLAPGFIQSFHVIGSSLLHVHALLKCDHILLVIARVEVNNFNDILAEVSKLLAKTFDFRASDCTVTQN